jgi:hypothetical protein
MTSIPLILHYPSTFHLLTNLVQFCPILTGSYIFSTNFELFMTLYAGTEEVEGMARIIRRDGILHLQTS